MVIILTNKIISTTKSFTNWISQEHGWIVHESPIIWRELLYQGGKGTLIGSSNEFQEYAAAYYNEFSQMTTQDMLDVAADNQHYKDLEELDRELQEEATLEPMTMLIIGAASPATTHLLSYIGIHGLFEKDQTIDVHLYDDSSTLVLLQQYALSGMDMASSKLKDIHVVEDLIPSLKKAVQIVILDPVARTYGVGGAPSSSITSPQDQRKTGYEDRTSWLKRREQYFTRIGGLIKQHCVPCVNIIVTGNPGLDAHSLDCATPINFDVQLLHRATFPTIQPQHIVGLVRPISQRIRSVAAEKLNVSSHDITDVVVWGNIGSTIHVDISRARVFRRNDADIGLAAGAWFSLPVLDVAREPGWLIDELANESLVTRSKRVPKYTGLNASQAILHFLIGAGTQNEHISSLVINSEGRLSI